MSLTKNRKTVSLKGIIYNECEFDTEIKWLITTPYTAPNYPFHKPFGGPNYYLSV
jgi:hypothetical protein